MTATDCPRSGGAGIFQCHGSRLNGIDVEVVSTEKDLGVVVVNDTSWKDHIPMIVAKANRLLCFIRRSCAGIVGSVALLRLYYSLVRSHFCYIALSYGHLSLLSTIYS